MKQLSKHIYSFFVLALFVILALSSTTVKNMAISKEGGQIPPDFGNTNDTLLVLKKTIPGIGIGKTVKNAMEKYKGGYKVIDDNELSKYGIDKFRYVIYLEHVASGFTDERGRPGPGTICVVMRDRQKFINYKTSSVPNFGKLLKKYVSKLNEHLK